jgi:6-pyruvoyltetrahydropterin/6-carboxytetrahydropterin synthase
MELRTSIVIAMAHRLADHPGLCRNLHGHNWTITAVIGVDPEEVDNPTGYVLEFGDLRRMLKNILDIFDHSTILQDTDELIPHLKHVGTRMHILNVPPTTEHLSSLFYTVISDAVRAYYPDKSVSLNYVELVETPNNMVYATAHTTGVQLL